MRNVQHVARTRVVPSPRVMYVHEATWIPSGMHGYGDEGWRGMAAYPVVDASGIASEPVVSKLVVNGVPESQARAIVGAAVGRVRSVGGGMGATAMVEKAKSLDAVFQSLVARGVPSERARLIVRRAAARRAGLSGMGQSATVDAAVLAKASDTQTQHQNLIAQYGAATDPATQLDIRNQIEQLYADWTSYAVGVENGQPPYQWNLADPTAAVLSSIRNDIANTVSLIDAGNAQLALQKNIVTSWAQSSPNVTLPTISPGDVPWYVWAGGGVVGLTALSKLFGK
jgi:hypothetical protein